MPDLDRAVYDRTALDWGRLRRYAVRVAAQTPLPATPLTYTRTVPVDVVRTERRRAGFLGLGRKDAQVTTSRWTRQSVTALDAHWVVDRRHWKHVETRPGAYTETQAEHDYLVLLPDGTLKTLIIAESEVVQIADHRYDIVHSETTHTLSDATAERVCRLDFARYAFRRTDRRDGLQHQFDSDRDPGTKLVKHAKGVGVNLALKDILEGRTPKGA